MITADPTIGTDDAAVARLLEEINNRLARIEHTLGDLERRVESIDELKEDLMPMANGMFAVASGKLEQLEQDGALEFAKEGLTLLETVSTSFTAEDVRLLGANLVGILETVRNMTQPEVLDVADRAAGALRQAESKPPEKIRFFKALWDPEIRRGMGVMLSVLREMGTDHEHETNGASGSAGEPS